ncbi:MAG: hypothetical protein K9I94_07420, partial [Bacteroidales bacterium]|nr:hypothetical protein [Bacteroidales bacterium]
MKYFWFILSFTFCSIFLVQGQETRFTFQKVESDIIIGRFKDLAQDGEGILWLTSDNGLIRYNSKTADYYPNAFETNFTKGFIKGKSDNLLLVHDQGVGRIYSLEKHNLFGLNALGIDSLLHYPKTLFRSSNGTYWIGEDSTLVSYKNGNFHRYDMGFNWHSISYIRTFSMVEDGFGNLWSFSYYGKTYAFDRNMKEFNVVNTPKFREISWAKRKGLDKIWIGCSSGIYELIVNGKQQVANVRKVAEISSVSTFRFINKDQVLVGTWNDGVYFLEIDEGNTRLRKIDKVDFQDILQITPDEDEGYWILSSEQLGLLTKSPFHYIQVDPTNNMMRSVGKAGNDRMIVSNGITISILKKRKKNWEKVYSYVTRNHHFYRALYYDDKIAVGDNYGQVFFLDPKTNEFEKIDGVEKGGEIGWLFEDLEKRLWVCGNTNVGLYRVDNEKDVQTFSKPGLKNIYVIKSGPAGKIYAAGHNLGSILYEYDYNSDSFSAVQLEATPHGKEQFVTEDLYIARDTIFMATSHGFYSTVRDEANPWKIKKIDIPAFGNSTYLKAIERTGDGAFWLASETGLIRYYNGRVQFFDQSNGLPTRAIKFRGLQEDNFGNLWIATEKGLTMLPDNEGIASKTATPQIEIAKIGGGKHKQQKGETKPNHFRYGSNLEFNYLSHSFPQKFVNYQVRIPQLDTAWSKLNKETQLNFMNFDQGEYTLQVRAIAKGHQFSDVNQVSFSIGKPWFGSSWFYLAVIITLS